MKRYELHFCLGNDQFNIPSKHLYEVYDYVEKREIGFMSYRKATERFGRKNIEISHSSTICPICAIGMTGKLKGLRKIIG